MGAAAKRYPRKWMTTIFATLWREARRIEAVGVRPPRSQAVVQRRHDPNRRISRNRMALEVESLNASPRDCGDRWIEPQRFTECPVQAGDIRDVIETRVRGAHRTNIAAHPLLPFLGSRQ